MLVMVLDRTLQNIYEIRLLGRVRKHEYITKYESVLLRMD